jgi:hypothetical protein
MITRIFGNERSGVRRAGRDDVLVGLGAAADQRTAVVPGFEIQTVIHPLLLNELELPEQARADPHENDAPFAVPINVRQPAPKEATPVGEPARSSRRAQFRIQYITRVGAADVSAKWALRSVEVVTAAKPRQHQGKFGQALRRHGSAGLSKHDVEAVFPFCRQALIVGPSWRDHQRGA